MKKPKMISLDEEILTILSSKAEKKEMNHSDLIADAIKQYKVYDFAKETQEAKPQVSYSKDNMDVILSNSFWKDDPQFVVNALIRREASRMESGQVAATPRVASTQDLGDIQIEVDPDASGFKSPK